MLKNSKIIFGSLIILLAFFTACEDDTTGILDDPRDEITRKWYCQEFSETYGEQFYEVIISKSEIAENEIAINNFMGLGNSKIAKATLSNRIVTIPVQNIDNLEINGAGSINATGTQIALQYTFNDGNGEETVTATYRDSPITGWYKLIVQSAPVLERRKRQISD